MDYPDNKNDAQSENKQFINLFRCPFVTYLQSQTNITFNTFNQQQ